MTTESPVGLSRSQLAQWLLWQLRIFAGLGAAAVLTSSLYGILHAAGDESGALAVWGVVWFMLMAIALDFVALLITLAIAMIHVLGNQDHQDDAMHETPRS